MTALSEDAWMASKSMQNIRRYVGYLLANSLDEKLDRAALIENIRNEQGANLARIAVPVNFHSRQLWIALIEWMKNGNAAYTTLVQKVFAGAATRTEAQIKSPGSTSMRAFYVEKGAVLRNQEDLTVIEAELGSYKDHADSNSPLWTVAANTGILTNFIDKPTDQEKNAVAVAMHTILLAIFFFEVVPRMPGLLDLDQINRKEVSMEVLAKRGHFITFLALALNLQVLTPTRAGTSGVNPNNAAVDSVSSYYEENGSARIIIAPPKASFEIPNAVVNDLAESTSFQRIEKSDVLTDIQWARLLFHNTPQANQLLLALHITIPKAGKTDFAQLSKLTGIADVGATLCTSETHKAVQTSGATPLATSSTVPEMSKEKKLLDKYDWDSVNLMAEKMFVKRGDSPGARLVKEILASFEDGFSWTMFSNIFNEKKGETVQVTEVVGDF